MMPIPSTVAFALVSVARTLASDAGDLVGGGRVAHGVGAARPVERGALDREVADEAEEGPRGDRGDVARVVADAR